MREKCTHFSWLVLFLLRLVHEWQIWLSHFCYTSKSEYDSYFDLKQLQLKKAHDDKIDENQKFSQYFDWNRQLDCRIAFRKNFANFPIQKKSLLARVHYSINGAWKFIEISLTSGSQPLYRKTRWIIHAHTRSVQYQSIVQISIRRVLFSTFYEIGIESSQKRAKIKRTKKFGQKE